MFWERIFVLYEVYQQKMERCDHRIEQHLKSMSAQVDNNTNPLPKPRKGKRSHGNAPSFDLRSELYRVTGTDLTQIDGINVVTAQAILADTGTDMSAWRTEKHFVSWLGLCPGSSYQRRESASARNAESYQQSSNGVSACGEHITTKSECARGQVPALTEPFGSTQGNHRNGSSPRAIVLPNDQVRL